MSRDVLRPSPIVAWLAPLPAISAATWLIARPPSGAAYDMWASASAALHDSLAISGPLMLVWSAALSAWATGRAWVFADVPARVRVRQHLRIVALATSLALLAHGVGLAPRLLFAVRTATDGRLSGAALVTAVAWAALFCSLGAVAGHVLSRGRWLAPLPLAVALATFLPPVYDRAWAILLPNKQWRPDASTHLSWPATLMVVALAACLVISTVLVVGRSSAASVSLGSRTIARPGAGLLVAVVGITALVTASFAFRPEIYVVGSPASADCVSGGGPRICLHPAHRSSLPTVQAAMGQLRGVGMGGYFPGVVDYSLDPSAMTVPGVKLVVDVDPTRSPTDVSRNAVYDLLLTNCPEPTGQVAEDDTSSFTVAYALAGAVLARLGVSGDGLQTGSAAEAAQRLTPEAIVKLLTNKQARVLSCSLRVADLA